MLHLTRLGNIVRGSPVGWVSTASLGNPSVGQSSFRLCRVCSHSLTHVICQSLKEVIFIPILEMRSWGPERLSFFQDIPNLVFFQAHHASFRPCRSHWNRVGPSGHMPPPRSIWVGYSASYMPDLLDSHGLSWEALTGSPRFAGRNLSPSPLPKGPWRLLVTSASRHHQGYVHVMDVGFTFEAEVTPFLPHTHTHRSIRYPFLSTYTYLHM